MKTKLNFKIKKSAMIGTALLTVLFVNAPAVHAQVTIGSMEDPSTGSLLDLKQQRNNGGVNATKGLLLPRVQLTDLTKLHPMFETSPGSGLPNENYDSPAEKQEQDAKHVGLTVYNTQGACRYRIPEGIYVWNGTKWEGGYPADPMKYVDFVVKVDENGNGTTNTNTPYTRTLRFLTYNLGANPNMTPKEQMAYKSPLSPTYTDMTVLGGFFQWGRKDAQHSLRCNKNDVPDAFTSNRYSSLAESVHEGRFVVVNSGDWISNSTDDLWGNGGGTSSQINTTYTGSQNIGNPCPSGYRVPTQHEWALLGNEGGSYTEQNSNDRFSTVDGTNSTIDGFAATSNTNPGVTWVRVKNGKACASWGSESVALCGYALYKSEDWSGAAPGYKDGSLLLSTAAAPDPLMFLPAGGRRNNTSNNGNVDIVGNGGTGGLYWSSVIHSTQACYTRIIDSSVGANAILDRMDGLSIRCIAEGN
jgi:hypothetical protein